MGDSNSVFVKPYSTGSGLSGRARIEGWGGEGSRSFVGDVTVRVA